MTADELQNLQTRLAQLEQERRYDRRRACLSWTCALVVLALSLVVNLRPAALAQSPGISLASLVARITALETKTAPITCSGTDLTITGVNVHIIDGNPYGLTDDGTAGETSNTALTGLGNLIIGYNATGSFNGDMRTGSHNLVLGDRNN